MSKDIFQIPAKDHFYTEHPEEMDAFEDLIIYLESLLNEVDDVFFVDEKRYFGAISERVDTVRGMRIYIYPNEHSPPHFHVRSANVNASFSINDCTRLEGEISNKDYRKIRYWFDSSKPKLIDTWDKTRPTDCIVGNYREN